MLKPVRLISVLVPILLAALGLSNGVQGHSIQPVQDETPRFNSYKGVSIGMARNEVREKLGDPKEPSDAMDYYTPSDDEAIQVFYEDNKVEAIMITFTGKFEAAPDPKTLFGVAPEVKPDGGIFKMVRYPKAGFWVSYNKLVGDASMITIAIKKI